MFASDVAMGDALAVRGVERSGDRSPRADAVEEAVLPRSAPSVSALHQFHHDERTALVLADVDRANVGMVQRRCRTASTLEARAPIGIVGDGGRQDMIRQQRGPGVSRALRTSPIPPSPARRHDLMRPEASARNRLARTFRSLALRGLRA
jgi:hypothetical protein